MIKLGIVGAGYIVREFLDNVKFLSADCGLQVAGVFSRTYANAETLAKSYGIANVYNSFEELLASDIDTVYIATQNDSHFAYSQKALLANKNVLCEKPACVNHTQLSEILDLANKKGLKFMEAMRFLHIPAYVELKKRLKSKAYGNIISIEGSLGKISQRTYRHTKDLCGGATMDLSIYPATAVIDLLGYPDHIASGCIKNDAEVDSTMSAIFSYNSGIIGNVHASFTTLTRG
ncbi:MAG: Gfo/Idh/MocA family oxidoreductase, partial [Deferribacteraceae bacterium]|nr:Gfo/Idh/MocA family oxidoreductase [Deferribacteraceae bacterium]